MAIDYELGAAQDPRGKNGLTSLANYYQRMVYKNITYPLRNPSPLDTWYDKQHYGKIDTVQNTVVLNPGNLKAIRSASRSNIMTPSFLEDAFQRLVTHLKFARTKHVVNTHGNEDILNMRAHKSYVSPHLVYSEYLQQLYMSFVGSLTPQQRGNIVNFRTYVKEFLPYLKSVSSALPITKSNFLLTPAFSSFNSGLSIAIAGGPADNDAYKYSNYISDPNFKFYVRSAKKFGFLVSKNAPWVLTADLFSDAMLHFLSKYKTTDNQLITKDNFFDTFYNRVYLTEIQELRTFIIQSYMAFIDPDNGYPLAERLILKPRCDKTEVEIINRTPITGPGLVEAVLSDKIMIDLYIDLRDLESKNAQPSTKKLRLEAYNVYRLELDSELSPLQNAAQYVNAIYRDYIYSPGSLMLNRKNLQKALDSTGKVDRITTSASVLRQFYY